MAKQKKPDNDNNEESKVSLLRGMKDVFFDEYKYWEVVLKKAQDLASAYGFKRIDTPILEKTELYEHTLGKDVDINKDMYIFTDPGGDKVALRPEANSSLARAYLDHNMYNYNQPIKLSWIGPVFQYRKTQSNVYRQFNQFSLNYFGDDSPAADFSLILVAFNFFKELQIPTEVQINSLGCDECSGEYLTALKKYYRSNKSDLCEECKKKMNKEPLLVLGCEEKKCRKINDKAPPIVDYLCDTCQNHFTKLLEYLDEMEIPYNLNTCLVRRMNYYNGPVFEIWPVDEKKDSDDIRSLAGGGRFNTLIAKLGQGDIHACGITIGIERTILRIKYNNIPLGIEEEDKIFLAQLGENARIRSFSLFEELRRCGFAVRQSFTSNNLKRQMEEAKKMGAKIILILGQKENNDNTILIRDGESGNQEIIDQSKIIEELTKRIQNKPQEKK